MHCTPPRLSGWPLAVDVLDRGLVAPDDVLSRQAEHLRERVPVFGTGCPSTLNDGRDAMLIDAGAFSELAGVEATFETELFDGCEFLGHPSPSSYLRDLNRTRQCSAH